MPKSILVLFLIQALEASCFAETLFGINELNINEVDSVKTFDATTSKTKINKSAVHNVNEVNKQSITNSKTTDFIPPYTNPQSPSHRLLQLLELNIKNGGENLSQGQKQLICVARALANRNASVLLLDEITSSIDAVCEQAITKALKNHIKITGQTLLVICHKVEAVKDLCDKVIKLEKGEITYYGDLDI